MKMTEQRPIRFIKCHGLEQFEIEVNNMFEVYEIIEWNWFVSTVGVYYAMFRIQHKLNKNPQEGWRKKLKK
jgi:hypothetical protein